MKLMTSQTRGRSSALSCLSAVVLLSFSAYSQASPEPDKNIVSKIPDFVAKYNIVHGGDIVGKATRALTNHDDGSVEFSYKTKIKWLILSDERKEITTNKVVDGKVIPLTYESIREGTGKDKYYHWQFDQQNSQATDLKKDKTVDIDWPEGLQSKLSFHLQSRFNLINGVERYRFPILSTSGKIREYEFEYVGTEELMLPYGLVDTVKLRRRKNDEKVTYAWFAPKLNYLLVKLHQIEGDFQQIEAELVSVEQSQQEADEAITPIEEP
ncbi:DUF3108 domain-containing protein [Thalassotalea mangrovi]|uniref:DUF3108 domain-containing protein n=1 Tax=Thalassotalea mangrovi TaxID=2572245 RepID=A0A4U1B3G2_9GAMM|nr:DUF3108 domain-containing protein [Thalassotalea mangrovi]TKB44373.1 DUF3108 domain-containing protein [Thalassotalea mangrovi]